MKTKNRSPLVAAILFLTALLITLLYYAFFELPHTLSVSPTDGQLFSAPSTAATTQATETLPTQTTAPAPTETIPVTPEEQAAATIAAFAESSGLTLEDYPESLVALLTRNPETADFVLHYPLEKDMEHTVDLSEYEDTEGVPLFMQWDKRWGYIEYGNNVAALTACGPVCLSMAAYALTRDEDMSPDKIIQFALDNGYCAPGNGSYWSLISEGGEELGLDVTELTLDYDRIVANLEVGNPIICVMGPGDFTSSGHFIVLTGVEDGLLTVNDPNSYARSEQLWDFFQIQDQIENLWAIRY
ncbi:MAG TPA: C39 family peptidase [Candidatus Faecousia intestinigallinarum]|nr:C39 family peptidase [Candidatus Faecousia intestinigallinarum]